MEIQLDERAVRAIRMATAEAIEEGDTESLRDDIFEAFPEDSVDTLEQLLRSTDFMTVIAQTLEQWSGDDIDELFEMLEARLADHGVDLKYPTSSPAVMDDDEDEYGHYSLEDDAAPDSDL